MLIDFHVHVGFFNGGLYFSPKEIAEDMKALKVERYYFSSTSTGNVPFKFVRREIEELVARSDGRAMPFLWVSPGMLIHSRDLKSYFFREFAGIKIHGLQGWQPYGKEICRVFSIAQEKNLPILLHTSEHEICHAGVYRNICNKFNDMKIILAHGRPIDETINVMNECPNVLTDTAFMPKRNILKLKEAGLIQRVLFGSDFPIMQYFFKTSRRQYYRKRLKAIYELLITHSC